MPKQRSSLKYNLLWLLVQYVIFSSIKGPLSEFLRQVKQLLYIRHIGNSRMCLKVEKGEHCKLYVLMYCTEYGSINNQKIHKY